jgi:hypothetical protein
LVDSIATVIYLYTHISIYTNIHQYTYTWSTSIYISQDLRWIISSFLFSHPKQNIFRFFPYVPTGISVAIIVGLPWWDGWPYPRSSHLTWSWHILEL